MSRAAPLAIFWISTAIFTQRACDPVDLTITPHWLLDCQVPVVLECHVSPALQKFRTIKMEWAQWCNISALGARCNYTENESLNLTIPSCGSLKDKQKYSCAIQTDKGHAIKNITIMEADCRDNFLMSVQANQKQCIFCANDSKGQVHWFHGNNNVTSNAINNRPLKTSTGLFRISSVLPIQGESDQIKCVLWLQTQRNHSQQHSMNKSRLVCLFIILILLSYI